MAVIPGWRAELGRVGTERPPTSGANEKCGADGGLSRLYWGRKPRRGPRRPSTCVPQNRH